MLTYHKKELRRLPHELPGGRTRDSQALQLTLQFAAAGSWWRCIRPAGGDRPAVSGAVRQSVLWVSAALRLLKLARAVKSCRVIAAAAPVNIAPVSSNNIDSETRFANVK